MKTKNILFILTVALLPLSLAACKKSEPAPRPYNEGINIIPRPQVTDMREGRFVLADGATIGATDPEAKIVANYFKEKLEASTGYNIAVDDEGEITLILNSTAASNPESYELIVTPNGVQVTACSPHGLFYGMQSFMQLLPAEAESPKTARDIAWEAPAIYISDSPRFAYRGIHFDPCRHFMTVKEMKKQIDVLSMFKINTIHWHLTDDQGWRVEIKKYPKLTETGGKRMEGEGFEYGPFFYTQDEVRDIVQYAADRFITIIPELEIPGHELAAIAAYPSLSCKGEPTTPRAIWGVEDIVMCPGKDSVFTFLEDVADELVALFPSTYFHIGGDECPKNSWKTCPLCQKRIQEEGIKADGKHTPEQLLQSYVVNRMGKYLAKHGKKIIGWDEILEGNPDTTATIMSWRGEIGGISAALAGHDAIMTPGSKGLYLDFYQGDSKIEPVAIGGYSSLEKVYAYEPVPDTLTAIGKDRHIIGVQANNWSEYFYTNDIREYHMYPRSLALAEIAWTEPERKDYSDFERRIMNAGVRLDEHGINYHIPLPEQPNGSCNHIAFTDSILVEFTTSRPTVMVYTTDGSDPNELSEIYNVPILFKESGTLKIASLLPSGKMSKAREITVEKQTPAPAKTIETKSPGLNMEVTYGTYLSAQELTNAKRTPDTQRIIADTKELTSVEPYSSSMRNVKQYAAVATGYVDIPESGAYVFSSDLEEVWIDGNLLINNSGEVKRHSRNDRSVVLEKGLHEVKLLFLGHIIGGWPSNWNDGSVSLRKYGQEGFRKITGDMLRH